MKKDLEAKIIIEELIKNEEIRQNIISTTDYIDWLNKYTETLNDKFFYVDDIDKKASEEDIENIKALHLFYDEIDKYAHSNYIYPEGSKGLYYYNIKHNDNKFKIGYFNGQGVAFFCKKVEADDDRKFLDFNDISSNKQQRNVNKISNDLEALSNNVRSLFLDGVPVEALEDTLESTIDDIKVKTKK